MEGNFDFIVRYYIKKIIMLYVRMVRLMSGVDIDYYVLYVFLNLDILLFLYKLIM